MADEQLKFIIGADSSQFNAELQKAENELKQFQAALKKTTDVNELDVLNGKIIKTQQTIAGLNSSMKSVVPSTNKATQSLTNLGRVVQDAPFGFIGIANNLNPLLESFQRLKQESGSTGGALKTLVSGLSGPAGIGIALSVVTAAFTFAEVGLSRWGLAAKKAKEEANKFQEGLRSAEQGALANAFRFQELTKVIRDTTKSERDRNLALAEANTILEPYGKKIDSINVSLAETTRLENSLTESLVNQAIALKIADKIADLTISKREKLNEIKRYELYIDKQKAINAKSAVNQLTGQTAGYIELIDAIRELNVQKEELAKIDAQINSLTADYSSKIVTTLKNTKQTGKETETLAQALAKFNKSLVAIQTVGTTLGTPQFEINNDKIKEFESFLKKIIEKFNVDPKNKIYLGLETRLNNLRDENFFAAMRQAAEINRKAAVDILGIIPIDGVTIELPKKPFDQNALDKSLREGLSNQLREAAKTFKFELPAGVFNLNTEGIKKQYDDLKKKMEEFSAEVGTAGRDFLRNAAIDIASGFGEALGAAITGGNIGEVFKNVFEQLASGVQALGKQLIQIGVYALIAKSALGELIKNPYAAIAVGIAFTALGAALKNLGTNAFAVGTRFAPGGMALVGERGPEMINLPRGSQVIPAAQTSQMMGGIGGAIEVFGMLRGQDIYFSNKKYGQTYKRTT